MLRWPFLPARRGGPEVLNCEHNGDRRLLHRVESPFHTPGRMSGKGRRRSLDNGSLLLVPRTTLAQAQKPRLPTKNGSIQDGTILGIRRLGNLSVPFRLSPRWQGVA
jgi:hypothetical protein